MASVSNTLSQFSHTIPAEIKQRLSQIPRKHVLAAGVIAAAGVAYFGYRLATAESTPNTPPPAVVTTNIVATASPVTAAPTPAEPVTQAAPLTARPAKTLLDPKKLQQLQQDSYEVVTPGLSAPLKVKPNMGVTYISDGHGGHTPIYIRAIYGMVAHENQNYVNHDWSTCDHCQTTEFQAINFHTDKLLASARAVDLTSQNYYFTHMYKFNSIYWKDTVPHYGEKRNVTLIEGFQSFGDADASEAFLKAIIQKSRYTSNGRLLVDISHQCKAHLIPQLKQMGFEDTNDNLYLHLPEKVRQRWLEEADQNRIEFPQAKR